MRAPTYLASTTALTVALAVAFAACKQDDEDAPAPVPTTDTAMPTPPPADPAAATGVVEGPTPPSRPATPTTPATPGTKVDAGAPADAGAGADAGKPDASAGDAGGSTSSSKLKACSDKCQGVLAACLTPTIPDGGGFPQPKDPAKCQAAFNTCSAACAP